jgi:dTDP-4-amino-4,6-dideoxygalactose transaminase
MERSQTQARQVPLGDLRREWREIGPELQAALNQTIERGQFILGPAVEAFEAEFARFCDVRHAVGVASGTDAITLALVAAGVHGGAEVITTTLTSAATATAIVLAGGRPVLVDIDPQTFNLRLDQVAQRVTAKTRALLPVHLYGRPVEMEPLRRLAAASGLALIEDACQAHGAAAHGRRTGGLGLSGCFSFYPSKNLGAYGDGGIITTDDAELADRLRLLRQYGWRTRDHSELLGFNSRLDELQAALLRAKLPHLESWNRRRRQIAARYHAGLRDLAAVRLPGIPEGHVFHLYVVRVPDRARVRQQLADRGIGTGVHYPLPIHRQPAFIPFVADVEAFPEADAACAEIMSLPMFPQLEDAEVDTVVDALRAVLS